MPVPDTAASARTNTDPASTVSPGGNVTTLPFTLKRLANGLRVILHEDHTSPIVTLNLLYHVGSKNEQPGSTGFAHLFEHLMFDGSLNVERGAYDRYCTTVGGNNNAFTTFDFTSYYLMLPSDRLELGLWLESDRMSGFAIDDHALETEKSVVMEEKRQSTDDVPYGDATTILRELAYQHQHPYSWEIIGSMEDIAGASMEQARDFYERYYVPSNAVLVIAGDFEQNEAAELTELYFSTIPPGEPARLPRTEPSQLQRGGRRVVADARVPFSAIFLAYHAPSIYERDLYALEILADILSDGESSRFYQALEYNQEIASETDCSIEDGELGSLLCVSAIAQERGISPETLESALLEEIRRVAEEGVSDREVQKVKNRIATQITHSLQSMSARAERLAYFEALFDDPSRAFREPELYDPVTATDVQRVARTYLMDAKPVTVEYRTERGS